MQEAEVGGLQYEAYPSKSESSYLKKMTKPKRTGAIHQMIETLPSKHRALSSSPSNTKRKKKMVSK
jgi:hypothetical protein